MKDFFQGIQKDKYQEGTTKIINLTCQAIDKNQSCEFIRERALS